MNVPMPVAFTMSDLQTLAAAHPDAALFRAPDARYWMNVVTKDHATPVAEVHDAEADIYIIQEGDADLYLGGELDALTSSPAPGQHRGANLIGASCRRVTAGDVIVIPPGTPHMVDAHQTRLVYLVIKIVTA